MTITNKLDECKAAVKQAAQNQISSEALHSKLTSCLDDASDIAYDLEIVFRGLLDHYLTEDTEGNDNPDFANTIALLKFSFDFALHLSSTTLNMSKIPFLLLEDVFECQTINQAETMWSTVESLESKITHPELFPKGKLVVLKMCNSILRKLSKSCHTEFCGRILLFLAAIYPISERSAVNLPGKINSSNVTYIDDADTYRQGTTVVTTAASSGDAMTVDGEEGEEVEVKGSSNSNSNGLTYELYSSFWKLQSFFASDAKAIDKVETWTGFNDSARKVFSLLENKECDELASSSSSSSSSGSSSENANETYLGSKYLTSSQLFSLQLNDSSVRQQLAVQVLCFIHYIRAKLPNSLPSDNTSILSIVSSDMLFLHNKASTLIERSKGGHELLQVVQRLISRENHWIAWKASSCPPFEKYVPALDGEAANEAVILQKRRLEKTTSDAYQTMQKNKKPKPGSAGGSASSTNLKSKAGTGSNSGKGYQFDCSDSNVKEKAKKLLQHLPDFKEQIQSYIDADDPDCGIDDAYHPKHDSVYCWRTRRLLAAHKLSVFQVMPDGNLSKGLRKYEGKPEPVEVVVEAEEVTPEAVVSVAAEGEVGEGGGTEGEGNTTSNTTAAVTPMETEAEETEETAAPEVAVLVEESATEEPAPGTAKAVMDTEVEEGQEEGGGSTTATDSLVGMNILEQKEEGEQSEE